MLTGRPEVSRNIGRSSPDLFGRLRFVACQHPLAPVGVRPYERSLSYGIQCYVGTWFVGCRAVLGRHARLASRPIPAGSPATANWCVLPRCEVEFEKCTGGFKIHCRCEDEVACGTLQNLCRMLCDGLCSCCCTLQRHLLLPVQPHLRHLQVRIHQGRLLHQLHLGRQGLLRDAPIVLRLPVDLLRERLLLLHLLQQHAGLLRHLLS